MEYADYLLDMEEARYEERNVVEEDDFSGATPDVDR